jgi:hypothetical protein
MRARFPNIACTRYPSLTRVRKASIARNRVENTPRVMSAKYLLLSSQINHQLLIYETLRDRNTFND